MRLIGTNIIWVLFPHIIVCENPLTVWLFLAKDLHHFFVGFFMDVAMKIFSVFGMKWGVEHGNSVIDLFYYAKQINQKNAKVAMVAKTISPLITPITTLVVSLAFFGTVVITAPMAIESNTIKRAA